MTLRKKFHKSARMTDKKAKKLAQSTVFLTMLALFIVMMANAPANAVSDLQLPASSASY